MRDDLVARLEIEPARDGVRLVTLNGVVLGRLGQDRDTGRWQLECRAGWMRTPSELESGEVEHAETWAVDEIANAMAMERRAYDEGKPWGDSPPPGVP
jgi:hypothetical protein